MDISQLVVGRTYTYSGVGYLPIKVRYTGDREGRYWFSATPQVSLGMWRDEVAERISEAA